MMTYKNQPEREMSRRSALANFLLLAALEYFLIKPYEFWHPRIFEAPFYVYLGLQCLLHRVGIKSLAKANYSLNHGEIGIASKYESQLAFDQAYFLPTLLVRDDVSIEEKFSVILEFVEEHGYPVILKSDVGCVGKGICKISSLADLQEKIPLLLGDYIVQKFTPYTYECGIFYIRYRGKPRITGINKKHFPTVIGNGCDTLLSLARSHYRYTHHWNSFLQYLDTNRVPAVGEEVRLSFIGSHTLGCKFTDDIDLLTPELETAIFKVFENQPGFNFGRIDVKSESEEALKAGKFVVIEVNGVASLPTHMFDPKFNILQAYKIFFEHGKYLVKIACEHKEKSMDLLSYREILNRVKANQHMLNQVHHQLKDLG
ncbi:hypothetical protein AB835_00805 [Candidatus Endobugula sertula]|uniref:ATP-grasp domain-containing protein n=1 Tax=Candidatus Endobugula sertula TaxID=62101 RepID=A0A1D2QU18_9GAMM|nr:hypothetical protein AB835_00805 [Candidatus Endobugula sertula]